MRSSTLLVIASALSAVSAGVTLVSRGGTIPNLLARQSSNPFGSGSTPSQCNTPCQTVLTVIDDCGGDDDPSSTCICTTAFKNDVTQCFDCIAKNDNSQLSSLQSIASGFASDCSAAGSSIGTINISTKNSAASLASGLHGMVLGLSAIGVAAALVL